MKACLCLERVISARIKQAGPPKTDAAALQLLQPTMWGPDAHPIMKHVESLHHAEQPALWTDVYGCQQ